MLGPNVNLISIIIFKYFASLTIATGVESIVTMMLSSTDRLIFGGTIIILDFEGFIVNLFALTHFRILMISKLLVDFKFDSESELTINQHLRITWVLVLTSMQLELHNQQAE